MIISVKSTFFGFFLNHSITPLHKGLVSYLLDSCYSFYGRNQTN